MEPADLDLALTEGREVAGCHSGAAGVVDADD
jgi:hypothetical protein